MAGAVFVIAALLEVVMPVFAVAAAGFFYAGWRPLPVRELTDVILHLTGACLVFDALVSAPRFTLDALRAPLSCTLVIAGGLLIGRLLAAIVPPLRRFPTGVVMAPAAFMNAGNLGLPLAALAFGDEGLSMMMLFFVTFSALHYSVGVAVVSGKGGVKDALKLPLLYAAAAGVAVNVYGLALPRPVLVPIELLGQTVIPFMLLSLGARLRTLLPGSGRSVRPLMVAAMVLAAARMVGGLGAAWLVNLALGNEGLVGQLTLLCGALPPAVMNFAIVEKYVGHRAGGEEGSALVSAAIAVGTLASIGLLPLVISRL